MDAGRKTQTILVHEKSVIPTTVNSSGAARNLRRSELCGAIFGCTDATEMDCFSNLLFGLPGTHYSYVKNIKPGVPLFLFNNSSRMMYGIFEAMSCGSLNINPHAWTDGAEATQFPAQVKVRILKQCKPLGEYQFSTIITENYFTEDFFWFELDQDQTSKLISLFSSFPTTWASLPYSTHESKTSEHASIVRQPVQSIELCVGRAAGSTPPQKSWISLFRSGNGEEKEEHRDDEWSEAFPALLNESWDVVVSGEMDDAREAAAETNPWVPSEQTMGAMLPFFSSEADSARESWEKLVSPTEETKEMTDLPAEKDIRDSSSNGDCHDEHLVVQSKVAEMFLDTISKLSTEVEGLRLYQSMQDQKISRLEYELEAMAEETAAIKGRIESLEREKQSLIEERDEVKLQAMEREVEKSGENNKVLQSVAARAMELETKVYRCKSYSYKVHLAKKFSRWSTITGNKSSTSLTRQGLCLFEND